MDFTGKWKRGILMLAVWVLFAGCFCCEAAGMDIQSLEPEWKENLKNEVVPGELLTYLKEKEESLIWEGQISAGCGYTVYICGEDVTESRDFSIHMELTGAEYTDAPAASFGIRFEEESQFPVAVTVTSECWLSDGMYTLFQWEKEGHVRTLGDMEVRNGAFTMKISEGGTYYVGRYATEEYEEEERNHIVQESAVSDSEEGMTDIREEDRERLEEAYEPLTEAEQGTDSSQEQNQQDIEKTQQETENAEETEQRESEEVFTEETLPENVSLPGNAAYESQMAQRKKIIRTVNVIAATVLLLFLWYLFSRRKK